MSFLLFTLGNIYSREIDLVVRRPVHCTYMRINLPYATLISNRPYPPILSLYSCFPDFQRSLIPVFKIMLEFLSFSRVFFRKSYPFLGFLRSSYCVKHIV